LKGFCQDDADRVNQKQLFGGIKILGGGGGGRRSITSFIQRNLVAHSRKKPGVRRK